MATKEARERKVTTENIKDLKYSLQAKTIGELLKITREQQKISIREISAKTKIRQKIIIYLENDNLAKLPNRAYVIGFLKTLTQTLGINYTEALEVFDKTVIETLGAKLPPTDFYLEDKYTSRKPVAMAFILITLAVTIVTVIYLLYKKPNEANSLAAPTTEKINVLPIKAITLDDKKMKSTIVQPGIINLSIKAIEGSCWIAYQVDDKPIVKYIMKKGKIILLTGQMIKLQVGNYKAISIEKDNVPVDVKKNTKSTTAHLIFPENLIEKTKPPFFIFKPDGSVDAKKQNEEKAKGI